MCFDAGTKCARCTFRMPRHVARNCCAVALEHTIPMNTAASQQWGTFSARKWFICSRALQATNGVNVVVIVTVIACSCCCFYLISHSAQYSYLLAFGAGIYQGLINLGDKRWTTWRVTTNSFGVPPCSWAGLSGFAGLLTNFIYVNRL